METVSLVTLTDLLRVCSSVSVKGIENGLYRAWGVGDKENIGKVVFCDGATPEIAISGLSISVARGQWRTDRFTRAF